jgi:hypothetical protein
MRVFDGIMAVYTGLNKHLIVGLNGIVMLGSNTIACDHSTHQLCALVK